jgi:hypothetical protein
MADEDKEKAAKIAAAKKKVRTQLLSGQHTWKAQQSLCYCIYC